MEGTGRAVTPTSLEADSAPGALGVALTWSLIGEWGTPAPFPGRFLKDLAFQSVKEDRGSGEKWLGMGHHSLFENCVWRPWEKHVGPGSGCGAGQCPVLSAPQPFILSLGIAGPSTPTLDCFSSCGRDTDVPSSIVMVCTEVRGELLI